MGDAHSQHRNNDNNGAPMATHDASAKEEGEPPFMEQTLGRHGHPKQGSEGVLYSTVKPSPSRTCDQHRCHKKWHNGPQ